MPFKWVRRRERAGRAAWTSSQSRHRNKQRAVSGSPFFFAAHAYKWPGVASAPDAAAWTSGQSCHRNKERRSSDRPFSFAAVGYWSLLRQTQWRAAISRKLEDY